MSEDEALTLPVLYGRHASPFVRRVAVTLRLYGIDYSHVPLMPFGSDKAELAAFNPIARVPALRLADGEMLVDSAVILDHLDQVAGTRSLTPAAGAARRRVLTLTAVALGANEKLVAGTMSVISGRAKPGTSRGWTPATSRFAMALAGSTRNFPVRGWRDLT